MERSGGDFVGFTKYVDNKWVVVVGPMKCKVKIDSNYKFLQTIFYTSKNTKKNQSIGLWHQKGNKKSSH